MDLLPSGALTVPLAILLVLVLPAWETVLWGFEFIFNVGIREAHLFGDNAAALVQFLRCKAS